ncbi:Hypothetical protein R9X50_00643300 [Acrodontium crateriforme]|uniref:Uncharacterized protein n=1 Tax=Acrodontium crateriforme TaxID=150365 RepID=A0AAQ3M7V9_9PEZI|nr:Hypothetical protein R9X50_00643300 [Acrodontium crateriforme]
MSVDDEEYDLKILIRHHQSLGRFPLSCEEIADDERLEVLTGKMQNTPPQSLMLFHRTTLRETTQQDKNFVFSIMKMDPRDRPTAEQLLNDEWFDEDNKL